MYVLKDLMWWVKSFWLEKFKYGANCHGHAMQSYELWRLWETYVWLHAYSRLQRKKTIVRKTNENDTERILSKPDQKRSNALLNFCRSVHHIDLLELSIPYVEIGGEPSVYFIIIFSTGSWRVLLASRSLQYIQLPGAMGALISWKWNLQPQKIGFQL